MKAIILLLSLLALASCSKQEASVVSIKNVKDTTIVVKNNSHSVSEISMQIDIDPIRGKGALLEIVHPVVERNGVISYYRTGYRLDEKQKRIIENISESVSIKYHDSANGTSAYIMRITIPGDLNLTSDKPIYTK